MIGCRWMGLKCKETRLPHIAAHGQRGFASERSPGMFAGIPGRQACCHQGPEDYGQVWLQQRSRFRPDGGNGKSKAPPGLHGPGITLPMLCKSECSIQEGRKKDLKEKVITG